MLPPDLYRSEAFAEDLPDGGYEPLALRTALPARPQDSPAGRARAWLGALRATLSARSLRPPRREGGAATQGA